MTVKIRFKAVDIKFKCLDCKEKFLFRMFDMGDLNVLRSMVCPFCGSGYLKLLEPKMDKLLTEKEVR